MPMLETVKTAVRRTDTNAFDDELQLLINAACIDLGIAGVEENEQLVSNETDDPILQLAICLYCKIHFGETDEFDHLKSAYDEIKAQLSMNHHYTDYSMLG